VFDQIKIARQSRILIHFLHFCQIDGEGGNLAVQGLYWGTDIYICLLLLSLLGLYVIIMTGLYKIKINF